LRAILDGIFKANNIEAIVYPTSSRRPQRIDAPPDPPAAPATNGSNLANLSGFPDLIVPCGFSTEDLPIGISFLGPAFTECAPARDWLCLRASDQSASAPCPHATQDRRSRSRLP
jgi:Asp-tRNA(Asn)/Glu-tRNA(Gln) amidotransferase A subunit family amidase